MKKFIWIMTALLLVVGVAVAQQARSGGAVLTIDKPEHDFGEIKEADGNVTHTFIVKNTGNQPLVLTRVVPSCGCTTPEYSREPIAPGKEGRITITFNPAGRPGQFSKLIAVYSNGKDGTFSLRVRGVVK